MLHHYTSESLDALARHCAENIKHIGTGDPFLSPWVVVQNKEISQWLSLQIASFSGISGNLNFVLPSELMWKLYRLYRPDTPTVLPSDRLPLHWRIFDLLIQTDKEVLAKVKGLPSFKNERQAFQLAGQVADVFDLYQMYRPEMTESWKTGNLSTNDPLETWQLWIWRTLYECSGPFAPDRGYAFQDLISQLANETGDHSKLPPTLFIFGLSHFSKPFTDLLVSISDYTDIHFYSSDIRVLKQDIFSTHWSSLLDNWGALKTSSIELLNYNNVETENVETESSYSSVFKTLQSDRQAREVIEIHSCHNPKREVEVLKDALLNKFENNEINAEDTLILVPDMRIYAPLLKSIFGFGEDEPSIPVFAPGAHVDPELRSFNELLEFISGDQNAGEFIDLIETDLFRSRFSFTARDLSEIRKLLIANNIHFGLDREASSFSLEKLQLSLYTGYSTETEGFQLFADIPPAEQIHSSEQLDLISRFSECINLLLEMHDSVRDRKAPEIWMELLNSWLTELKATSFILSSRISHLTDQLHVSGSEVAISFDLFKGWLSTQLTDMQASSSGIGHGVVVSSYIPYRSTPFKFIAILGLNENAFPRNPVRPEFDLINNDPKPGERITRKDDELLFLEIIHSAEKNLYLSYLGQDQHSENERLPSVLIQKLIDVIEATGDRVEIIREKLHGFHSSYYLAGNSYSSRRKKLTETIHTDSVNKEPFLGIGEALIPELIPEKINIHQFVHFFTHPSKYFLQHVLGIREGKDEGNPDDRELFLLDGLSAYKVDEFIAAGMESGSDRDDLRVYAEAKGMIPQGMPGYKAFQNEWEQVSGIWSAVKALTAGVGGVVDIQLEIGGVPLHGTLENFYNGNFVTWRTGKERAKDLVSCWLYHLLLQSSMGKEVKSFLVCKDGKNEQASISEFGAVEEAEILLEKLVDWFLKGHYRSEYLSFFPETSRAYHEATQDPKSDPLIKASGKWESSKYHKGEGGEFYNNLLWRGEDPLTFEHFQRMSSLFWKPLLNSKIDRS